MRPNWRFYVRSETGQKRHGRKTFMSHLLRRGHRWPEKERDRAKEHKGIFFIRLFFRFTRIGMGRMADTHSHSARTHLIPIGVKSTFGRQPIDANRINNWNSWNIYIKIFFTTFTACFHCPQFNVIKKIYFQLLFFSIAIWIALAATFFLHCPSSYLLLCLALSSPQPQYYWFIAAIGSVYFYRYLCEFLFSLFGSCPFCFASLGRSAIGIGAFRHHSLQLSTKKSFRCECENVLKLPNGIEWHEFVVENPRKFTDVSHGRCVLADSFHLCVNFKSRNVASNYVIQANDPIN